MGTADLPLEVATWLPVVQASVDRIQHEAAKPGQQAGSVRGGGFG